MKDFSRESRLQNVDKAVFPRLLNKLWDKLNQLHAINGFKDAGLIPLDKERMLRRVIPTEANYDKECDDGDTCLMTPRSAMRKAVCGVLRPELLDETAAILKDKAKKRKRVQAKTGEVLTEVDVARRLQLEEIERNEKKEKKKLKKKGNSTAKKGTTNISTEKQTAPKPTCDEDADTSLIALEDFEMGEASGIQAGQLEPDTKRRKINKDAEESEEDREEERLREVVEKVKQARASLQESESIGGWFAIDYLATKRKKSALLIAKVLERDGEKRIQFHCLRPKFGPGEVIEDTPEHRPDDWWGDLENVIYGPLQVEYLSQGKYTVKEYQAIVKHHKVFGTLNSAFF